MRTIYVPIPDGTAERLQELARRELRDPKAQAAILLAEAVERAIRKAERRDAVTAARRDAR